MPDLASAAPATEATRGADERAHKPAGEVFAWDRDELVVTDQAVLAGFRRPALSPSTSKAMDGCPARWASEKALGEAHNPFGAAELGTSAHLVLEDFFDVDLVPPSQRTPEKAMAILLKHSRKEWPGRDEHGYAQRGLWISAVHDAYAGIFDIEDPRKIRVHSREMAFGRDGGKEVEVGGIPFVGFIDRVDETDEGLVAVDYKSSRKKPVVKFGDDHGEQMRLYSEVLRIVEGKMPAEALLHYTRLGVSRSVPIKPIDLRKTIAKFQRSWSALNRYIDNGAFATTTSALCGWCPVVATCPSAALAGKGPRKEGLKTAVELGIPTLRPLTTATFAGAAIPNSPTYDGDFGSASVAAAESFVVPDVLVDPPVNELVPSAHLNDASSLSQKDFAMESKLLVEDKPYYENAGGGLNPNSYAAGAVFGLASMAYDQLHRANLKPSRELIDALAQTFAYIVDVSQRGLTGVASFQDGTNRRYRGALHSYIDANAIPFGGTAEQWDSWVHKGVSHVGSIGNAALRLYATGPVEGAWRALVATPERDEFAA